MVFHSVIASSLKSICILSLRTCLLILNPFWTPKCSKIGLEIRSKSLSIFWSLSTSIWSRFLLRFGISFGAIIRSKSKGANWHHPPFVSTKRSLLKRIVHSVEAKWKFLSIILSNRFFHSNHQNLHFASTEWNFFSIFCGLSTQNAPSTTPRDPFGTNVGSILTPI